MITGGLFVMGTDTGVGKTVLAGAIAASARARGLRCAPLKPAQTGGGHGPGDAGFVARLAACDEPLHAIRPYALRAPLAPAVAAAMEGVRLDPERVVAAHAALRSRHDLVIVEAAGGALVPFCDGVDMCGLAVRLGLPVVLAARPGLGTLNHILLTLEAMHRRGLTVLGTVLVGVRQAPGLADASNPLVLARLTPVPLLGAIPHDDAIDADAGAPGDLARAGPATLDPLLGGTWSAARYHRVLRAALPTTP